MSTSTTATAWRRSSTTIRACSRSRCTRPVRCSSRHRLPARQRRRGGRGVRGQRRAPARHGRRRWLRAFHAVVPPLLREFRPEVLVTQHGCDSHMEDPLAHLMLSVDGQRAAYLALHELAHEVCDGKWVVTGGGGYALVEVVPRAWTHLLAIVPAGRWPRRPRPRSPGATTSPRSLGRTAPLPPHRRPQPGLSRLGRGLRPRDVAGSGDHGHALPRSSRCTASTRTPEINPTRRCPTSFFSNTLPHKSHWPYCLEKSATNL